MGGGNVYQSINTMPSYNVINCGFAPKKVLITLNYSGNHLSLFWDSDNPNVTQGAYGSTITTDAPISSGWLSINPNGITIDSSTFANFNNTTNILICG